MSLTVMKMHCIFIAYHMLSKAGTGLAAASEFQRWIPKFVSKYCQMIKEDDNVHVVCSCLDTLALVLRNCKSAVTSHTGVPEK